LREVLDGDAIFEEFWEWLHAQQFRVGRGSPEQRLVYAIIARFEEYDDGLWDDEQVLVQRGESSPVV